MDKDSYEGPAGGLRAETPWLAVEDIDGQGDLVVTVIDVKRYGEVTFDEGRTQSGVGALVLAGRPKELIINAARRKSMIALYGNDTRDWRGKSVTIFVDPGVKMKGKKVGGIRIRPSAPKPTVDDEYDRVRAELDSKTRDVAKQFDINELEAANDILGEAGLTLSGQPTLEQCRALIGAAGAILAKGPDGAP